MRVEVLNIRRTPFRVSCQPLSVKKSVARGPYFPRLVGPTSGDMEGDREINRQKIRVFLFGSVLYRGEQQRRECDLQQVNRRAR